MFVDYFYNNDDDVEVNNFLNRDKGKCICVDISTQKPLDSLSIFFDDFKDLNKFIKRLKLKAVNEQKRSEAK